MTVVKDLQQTVEVLRQLKIECETVWRDTKDDSIQDDTTLLRGTQQAYNWYVSVSEMLEMYEDLLNEAKEEAAIEHVVEYLDGCCIKDTLFEIEGVEHKDLDKCKRAVIRRLYERLN